MWRPSPNFADRNGAQISLLVLHYTGMPTAEAAISRLCDTAAQVSAHYAVDEDGSITHMVQESQCAWHAGLSFWRGHRNVNPVSIGIEIVNPGHECGYRGFPPAQMEAVAELCQGIIARHAIKLCNVVGHSDVAPQRKEDPGELFNWRWLAEQGVGVWPEAAKTGMEGVMAMQSGLAQYGYDIPQNGLFDEQTRKVAVAFQRHFRPSDISGIWDAQCAAILQALLALAR